MDSLPSEPLGKPEGISTRCTTEGGEIIFFLSDASEYGARSFIKQKIEEMGELSRKGKVVIIYYVSQIGLVFA